MRKKIKNFSLPRDKFFKRIFLRTAILGMMVVLGFFISENKYENKEFSVGPKNESIRVCFSPDNQCENLIVSSLENAEQTIFVQAYMFTSKPIAQALLRAKKNGVNIGILCDKSQFKEKYSVIPMLKKNGIKIHIDKVPGLAHNKILIIDEKTVFTGSYNFTKAANTRNSENLLFIKSPALAQRYLKEWQYRFNAQKRDIFTPLRKIMPM